MTDEHLQRSENTPEPEGTDDGVFAPPVDPSKPSHEFWPVEGNRFCGDCGAGKLHPIHTIRLAIRGFGNGQLQFEDRVAVDPDELENLIPQLAEKHALAMARYELHMIEIEYLDEPDVDVRFFRIGTDPSRMVK